jgi:hypothetical protein
MHEGLDIIFFKGNSHTIQAFLKKEIRELSQEDTFLFILGYKIQPKQLSQICIS